MSPALKCLLSKCVSLLCYNIVSRIIPSDESQGAALYCLDRCNVLLLVGAHAVVAYSTVGLTKEL